jgi:Putative glycolipid-binding
VLVGPTWATEDVEVVVSFPNGDIREPIELGALWSGKERPPEFRDCVDVDLGFTPATNTLPIRRLGLEVGEAAGLAVAWLNGPRSVSNVPSSATSAWPVTATATRPATSRRT